MRVQPSHLSHCFNLCAQQARTYLFAHIEEWHNFSKGHESPLRVEWLFDSHTGPFSCPFLTETFFEWTG